MLTGDAKAILNQATLDIDIHTVDNFNKALLEMTKHTFPAYVLREQKRYLRRNLVKPRSIELRSFISKLQELNAYLEEFPPDTEGQETAPLLADKIFSLNLEPKEGKKKSSMAVKKIKKWKQEDFDSSVAKSSKVSIEARRPRKNTVHSFFE